MFKKSVVLLAMVAFVAWAGLASANETTLKPGDRSECIKAGWVAYNSSESKETVLEFNVGPIAYGWGKVQSVELAPGGMETNAIAQKTEFTNKGPGDIIVNCQRQRFDRHDWKIDPGSGKTYQSDYHLDHVRPGTYIEPGLGMPQGTERGLFSNMGNKSEANR